MRCQLFSNKSKTAGCAGAAAGPRAPGMRPAGRSLRAPRDGRALGCSSPTKAHRPAPYRASWPNSVRRGVPPLEFRSSARSKVGFRHYPSLCLR